jgi:aryl-alcohol dehydrogenase-like predicted oxidoreductase
MDEPILKEIGERSDAAPYEVALFWLLCQGDHVLPILGASKIQALNQVF